MFSPFAIGVSRLAGKSSAVTSPKTPSVSETTAGHADRSSAAAHDVRSRHSLIRLLSISRQMLLMPPSTSMSEPVMNALSSEARKTAAEACSSGRPSLNMGT